MPKPAQWSETVRQWRKDLGITSSEFAKLIGRSTATISNWENRKSIPSKKIQEEIKEKVDGEFEYSQKISEFGIWLRDERSRQGMSVPQLAEKSGVSSPAIYNIENGKSLYPQQNTIEKLSKALNKNIPESVEKAQNETQTIEGLGKLTDFDPHQAENFPNCAGVYVFYDITDRPIYVGQSENIKKRLKDHKGKFWFKKPIVEVASYIEISDKKMRVQIEHILIRFLKSNAVMNKKGVVEDK